MIQEKIERIQEIAASLLALHDDELLFEHLNQLDRSAILSLQQEYEGVLERFSPVNLLRYEVLNHLDEGRPRLTPAYVQAYRESIEKKDVHFFKKYGVKLTNGLINYPKDSIFNPYQKKGQLVYFRIFYTFFFRKSQSKIVLETLHDIGNSLCVALGLTNQKIHVVDFRGSANFGSTQCWIAIYPPHLESHQDTDNLFLTITPDTLKVGLWSGVENKEIQSDYVSQVSTYADAVAFLKSILDEYITRNQIEVPTSMGTYVSEGVVAYQSDTPKYEAYTKADALNELFIPEVTFEEMLDLLKEKKNLILQGPPGVGKTFVAKRLAYCLIGQRSGEQVSMVQFHQSYAYEDFVQGIRPRLEGGFEVQKGLFYQLVEAAHQQPNEAFVLIIDEINRGNLSKIFGELMLLIESDKRSADYAVRLTYEPSRAFFVPPNVYLIGTMNTADRSLSLVDFALRRRFAFVDLDPVFGALFGDYLTQLGAKPTQVEALAEAILNLNDAIEVDKNLGKGFRIGHSYFIPSSPIIDFWGWYMRIVRHEIAPLLREYWFDDTTQAEKHISKLLAASTHADG